MIFNKSTLPRKKKHPICCWSSLSSPNRMPNTHPSLTMLKSTTNCVWWYQVTIFLIKSCASHWFLSSGIPLGNCVFPVGGDITRGCPRVVWCTMMMIRSTVGKSGWCVRVRDQCSCSNYSYEGRVVEASGVVVVRWRPHVTVPLDALHQPVNSFINTGTSEARH